jgi:NADH dehydrogenase
MSGVRERVEAFVDWAWNYFSRSRAIQILDRTDVSHIDWGNETENEDLSSTSAQSAR